MLLGFKRQFAPYVEEGSKTHTIRGLRKRLWRPGDRCDCYVDPRQKTMRLLGRWSCVAVEPIAIHIVGMGIEIAKGIEIRIADRKLDYEEAELFAWRDGFRLPARPGPTSDPHCDSSLDQLRAFWWREHFQKHQYTIWWNGGVIHWDYSRPAKLYDR